MSFDDSNFPSLPKSWVSVPIGKSCENLPVREKVQQKNYLSTGALPIVDQGAGQIGGYTNDLGKSMTCELPVIVFGDHTRALKFIDFSFAAGADGIKILRPQPYLNPRLCFRFLQAVRLPNRGYSRHFQFLRESKIPIPPLREQDRLVEKIEALLARVETCRKHLGQLPPILKRFRESVLEAAVSGRLTEEWRNENPTLVDASSDVAALATKHAVAGGHKKGNAAPPTNDVHDLEVTSFPNGWGLVDLRELVDPTRPITYGILKPGPELPSGVPYVRVADFPNDKLNLATIRRTSPQIDKEFARARLRPGDLLLSIRGTVGRIVVVPPELEGANITQDSARLSIQDSVNARYVLWYLRSTMARDRMRGATKGVAVRGINIGDVRALQVPLPSQYEQKEIVRRVEELFALADALERSCQGAMSRAEKLTPAVLAKAFRGELVPQNPNDEPAIGLLERVKLERERQLESGNGATRVKRAGAPTTADRRRRNERRLR